MIFKKIKLNLSESPFNRQFILFDVPVTDFRPAKSLIIIPAMKAYQTINEDLLIGNHGNSFKPINRMKNKIDKLKIDQGSKRLD